MEGDLWLGAFRVQPRIAPYCLWLIFWWNTRAGKFKLHHYPFGAGINNS